MRVVQKTGTRGSLLYLQQLMARRADLLDNHLRVAGVIPPSAPVKWVSPRADDDWAEYRDGAFLERIGRPELKAQLGAFWPARGPQWDALGVAGDIVLLVEAKAHVGEMQSSCTAVSAKSHEKIAAALGAVRDALGARRQSDWMNQYYQLANRLAHLWFLRQRGVDAWLVLLQFTGHATMPTSSSEAAYRAAIRDAVTHLGFDPEAALPGVVHVYQDVTEIE